MSYLERNHNLLAELSETFEPRKGDEVGRSVRTTFFSAGSYHSSILDQEIHVGLKYWKDVSIIEERLIRELAIMSVIAEKMPHLLPELPLFYGLLLDKEGQPVAIVTEDFSKAGQDEVWQSHNPPVEIMQIFPKGAVHLDEIEKSAFDVGERRRLGDFWPFLPLANDFWEELPVDSIRENLGDHSIKSKLNPS